MIGLIERSENFLADNLRLFCRLKSLFAQIFQHHHEFVTAQTRHGVAFAHAGRQALRNLLQQQISDVMAKRVIEGFEIIQINEQQRPLLSATRTGSQCLLQPIQQTAGGWAGA